MSYEKMISKNIKPSIWVEQVTSKIEHGGTLIDIACGEGRHSTLLCKNFFVYAVDKNNDYLKNLKNIPNLQTIYQDLESDKEWDFLNTQFNVVLVTNYLFREKLLDLFKLVKLNGYIIYETFAVGNEKHGRPTNPNYLLKSKELLKIRPKNFNIIEFYEGEKNEDSKKSIVQRLLAKRVV